MQRCRCSFALTSTVFLELCLVLDLHVRNAVRCIALQPLLCPCSAADQSAACGAAVCAGMCETAVQHRHRHVHAYETNEKNTVFLCTRVLLICVIDICNLTCENHTIPLEHLCKYSNGYVLYVCYMLLVHSVVHKDVKMHIISTERHAKCDLYFRRARRSAFGCGYNKVES